MERLSIAFMFLVIVLVIGSVAYEFIRVIVEYCAFVEEASNAG